MMGKYGKAIGILHVDIGEADFDVKPDMKDIRAFRNLFFKHGKDKEVMFDSFINFFVGMIRRDNPEDGENEIREYVELNAMDLFQFVMVELRFTKKEEIERLKKESVSEVKNLMSND